MGMSSGNAMNCETIRGSESAVIVCVITLLIEGCDGPKSSLLHRLYLVVIFGKNGWGHFPPLYPIFYREGTI